MQGILKKFTRSPSIPHFRLIFPLRSRRQQAVLTSIENINKTSPAMFISLNGFSENPVFMNTLHDTIKLTSQRKKVPVYTFLEDNIDGLAYYVATASNQIIANPFCKFGELAVPTRIYHNIRKLMEYFGIKVDKIGGTGRELWDYTGQVTQQQKQFTSKWLQVISQKLQNQIQKTRSLPKQSTSNLHHLLSPKKALSLKLIDKIQTMQQFKNQHFPNNKLIQKRFYSGSENPSFTHTQLSVLVQMNQWMGMPRIVLMSMEDPVKHVANGFLEILAGRLGDKEKMQELDDMAGRILGAMEAKISDEQMSL